MLGLVFLAVDFFEWPRWTRHYKVQPGTNEPLNLLDVKDVNSNPCRISIGTRISSAFTVRFSDKFYSTNFA